MKRKALIGCGLVGVILLAAVGYLSRLGLGEVVKKQLHFPSALSSTNTRLPRTISEKIVAGAKEQKGILYVMGYVKMDYPDGDVPANQGVCTDVVVRALRKAGYDLQALMHEDMKRHFHLYPQIWGLQAPDPNIDHRRVPNQICFFNRHGLSLTTEVSPQALDQWQPGDIVYLELDNGRDHCGVISDERNGNGIPLVIHNLGFGKEEDCLTRWEVVGHFRYPKPTK
jgi:hypothetical protein